MGPSYNLTCQTYHDLVDFDANKQLKADAACPVNSTFAGTAHLVTNIHCLMLNGQYVQEPFVLVMTNKSSHLYTICRLELLLLIYFLSEFITRAVVSRKVRIFFEKQYYRYSIYNNFHILSIYWC